MNKPTVVVMDIRVNSDNPKVQEKIVDLTAKVRDQISEQTTECNVVRTKQMRSLSRQHRKAISTCYDDCGVEFGLLVGADFVITGHLEPSSTEILAVMEIRDTRTRNIVSTKKIRGANYFDLERALLSAVRSLVKPLNNIVMQATDDEVVSDEPTYEDDDGDTSQSATGSGPESEYLAPAKEKKSEPELTPLGERWLEAQQAPPLLEPDDERDSLFGLGFGVNAGYSLNVAKGRMLRELYQPVLHVGFQVYYQLHPLVQIAIVGDMDFLNGQVAVDSGFEYVPDEDLEITQETNIYQFKKYNTIGIRPTVRLTAPIQMVELFVGVGIGFNYVSTSGTWWKRRFGTQYYQNIGTPPTEVDEDVLYYFELSSFAFYAAVDLGLTYRLMEDRLGIGVLIQYKMPSMWSSGTDAKALPDTETMKTQEPPFTTPSESDTIHSPIRHVDSLTLLTFGAMLDWRF